MWPPLSQRVTGLVGPLPAISRRDGVEQETRRLPPNDQGVERPTWSRGLGSETRRLPSNLELERTGRRVLRVGAEVHAAGRSTPWSLGGISRAF